MIERKPASHPQVGHTQHQLLELLKRQGQLTVGEMGEALDLTAGTLREHLNSLGSNGLVERTGTRRNGPGRPHVVYGLTAAAESLFPNNAGEMLSELVRYLVESGQLSTLEKFFTRRIAARKESALARVKDKVGRERTEEVARILSENGFMADVVDAQPHGKPVLRLCHCPIRDAVAVTQLPCAVELSFVRELLDQPMVRTEHIPAGGHSCSYEVS